MRLLLCLLTCCLTLQANELIVNGDFTQLEAGSTLTNWKLSKATLETIDGKTALVLDGSYASAAQRLTTDPAWHSVELNARVRAQDVVVGDQSWKNGRIVLTFQDAAGKRVGPWPAVYNATGSTEWEQFVRIYEVPEGAKYLQVKPANFGASGRLELHSLSLRPAVAPTVAEDGVPPVIILKLDDVTRVTSRWERVANYLKAEQVAASFGIIGHGLEELDPRLAAWVTDLNQNHAIEFWNHGYKNRTNADKVGEFEVKDVAEQLASLQATQRLAKEKLGLSLTVFGPHWSSTNSQTIAALKQTPELKAVFYYTSQTSGPWFVFKRDFSLEKPIFKPNAAYIKERYEAVGKARPYLCFQGHPQAWNDESFEQFKQVVQYLKQQGCTFMTPTGYLTAKAKGTLPTKGLAPPPVRQTADPK